MTRKIVQDVRFGRLVASELAWDAVACVVAAGLWVAESMLPRDDWRRVERRQRRAARRQHGEDGS